MKQSLIRIALVIGHLLLPAHSYAACAIKQHPQQPIPITNSVAPTSSLATCPTKKQSPSKKRPTHKRRSHSKKQSSPKNQTRTQQLLVTKQQAHLQKKHPRRKQPPLTLPPSLQTQPHTAQQSVTKQHHRRAKQRPQQTGHATLPLASDATWSTQDFSPHNQLPLPQQRTLSKKKHPHHKQPHLKPLPSPQPPHAKKHHRPAKQRPHHPASSTVPLTSDTSFPIHDSSPLGLHADIITLRGTFDGTRKGTGALKDKSITIAYEHILGPSTETRIENGVAKQKLTGLHHDFKQQLETRGIIKNKTTKRHGIYKADVHWQGAIYRKTFFPSEWPRETVIRKILEAYDNASGKASVNKRASFELTGKTTEGITIFMVINKSGRIITAYPRLK